MKNDKGKKSKGAEDWCRKSTWSKSDSEDFFSRLERSKTTYNKAQYLCIQAGHLSDPEDKSKVKAALGLLDLMFEKYPDPARLALGYLNKARCFEMLGDPKGAVEFYRMALQSQRKYPDALTQAHLEFGKCVVRNKLTGLYAEILGVLKEFERLDMFPADKYWSAALKALIFESQGNQGESKMWAVRALQEAGKTNSGFKNHPKVGLVQKLLGQRSDDLRDELTKIVEG